MSRPQPAQPAKLVIGLFANNKQGFVEVCSQLQASYGPVDLISRWFDFSSFSVCFVPLGQVTIISLMPD